MASYLERLAARTLEPARLLQPRLPARFGPELAEAPSIEAEPAAISTAPRAAGQPQLDAPSAPLPPRHAASDVETAPRETTRAIEVTRPVPLAAESVSPHETEPRVAPATAVDRPFFDEPPPPMPTTGPLDAAPRPEPRGAGPATPAVSVRRVERVERQREEVRTRTTRIVPSEADVHITIGRIDVRAVTPPPAAPPAPRTRREPPKTQSLEEYLAQRNGERR